MVIHDVWYVGSAVLYILIIFFIQFSMLKIMWEVLIYEKILPTRHKSFVYKLNKMLSKILYIMYTSTQENMENCDKNHLVICTKTPK